MKLYLYGIFLILFGLLVLTILAFNGLVKAGLFLFFPFVISSSPLSIIPFILIFIGILLTFLSFNDQEREKYMPYEHGEYEQNKAEKENHVGGFLMIGPIPIIFGNDRRLIYVSIAVAVSIIIVYLIITFHLL
jgi:uncharacterized protein (TIGR00304 family)